MVAIWRVTMTRYNDNTKLTSSLRNACLECQPCQLTAALLARASRSLISQARCLRPASVRTPRLVNKTCGKHHIETWVHHPAIARGPPKSPPRNIGHPEVAEARALSRAGQSTLPSTAVFLQLEAALLVHSPRLLNWFAMPKLASDWHTCSFYLVCHEEMPSKKKDI